MARDNIILSRFYRPLETGFVMGRYMPPKKTGTALMGQKAEDIEKYNKKTKVRELSKEEIEAYLEEKRLKEEAELEADKNLNEKIKGKRI